MQLLKSKTKTDKQANNNNKSLPQSVKTDPGITNLEKSALSANRDLHFCFSVFPDLLKTFKDFLKVQPCSSHFKLCLQLHCFGVTQNSELCICKVFLSILSSRLGGLREKNSASVAC